MKGPNDLYNRDARFILNAVEQILKTNTRDEDIEDELRFLFLFFETGICYDPWKQGGSLFLPLTKNAKPTVLGGSPFHTKLGVTNTGNRELDALVRESEIPDNPKALLSLPKDWYRLKKMVSALVEIQRFANVVFPGRHELIREKRRPKLIVLKPKWRNADFSQYESAA